MDGLFTLAHDFGTVTIPNCYQHETALTRFTEKSPLTSMYSWYRSDNVDYAQYGNPTRILKPGERFYVRAFQQTRRSTYVPERMAFLAEQGAVLVGAQGAVLVWEQKRNELVFGKMYVSYDTPDRLPIKKGGKHLVPAIHRWWSDGSITFERIVLENQCVRNNQILAFFEA